MKAHSDLQALSDEVADLRDQVRKLTDDVDGARRVAIEAERERDEAREKSARRGVLVWQAEQERDQALKERDEARAESRGRLAVLEQKAEELRAEWRRAERAEAERDLQRATLEPTEENVEAMSVFVERWYSKNPPWTEPEKAASAILAALRAKAGLP